VLKKKHQAVSQGKYKLEARGLEAKKVSYRQSGFELPADCM
jgi:hypothetical protein